jgi:hypothetical protein
MASKLVPLTQPGHENRLHDALSEHVVFHSPVRDYHGRADVAHILMTIGEVLDRIEVERELTAEHQLVSVINVTQADRSMSGVLEETCDADGRVERATLLLRPLSTLLEAITAMRTALEQSPLPSTLGAGTGDGAGA